MSALERILALAKEGLPIVLVGEVPTASAFYGANWKGQDQEIVTLCRQLCTLKNVTRVADEASVPAALKAFGIRPALEPQKPVNLLSVHRRIDQTDYYYILYRGTAAEKLSLSLEGNGHVTWWNPWNGKIMGLDAERGDGKQQVEVVMQPGETAIFCVGEEAAAEYQAATQELLRISDNWGIEFERWEMLSCWVNA